MPENSPPTIHSCRLARSLIAANAKLDLRLETNNLHFRFFFLFVCNSLKVRATLLPPKAICFVPNYLAVPTSRSLVISALAGGSPPRANRASATARSCA